MIGTIKLPWPSRVLHPNARVHWAKKAKETRLARSWARVETRMSGLSKLDLASLKATIVFHPPDQRRRDLDGMLSSMKPFIDGISDAIGVDDSAWQIAIRRDEPVKNGAVKVILEIV